MSVESWPGWDVWQTPSGWHVATRTRLLSWIEITQGLDQTVITDTAEELARALRAQADREAQLHPPPTT